MKKSKIITIILILVVIINVLILISMIMKKSKTRGQSEIKSPTSQEYTQAKSLNIKNSSNLSNMDLGNIYKGDIYNYTNNYITKLLPDLYKQINDKTDFSFDYFSRKRSGVYKYSHIYKYDDYINLIDTMKSSGINFEEYETIEFVSCINNDDTIILNCELTYTGNKKIKLQLTYVNNEISETKLTM